METRPRAVDDYLRQLEQLLRDVPRDRRNETLTEIEAHIDALLAEHGPAPSEADARNVLERVGSAEDIAREARDEADAPPPVRRRWTDVAAVVALPIPLIGWVVGAVLLWMSDVWGTRDKIIGTLAGPGLFVLGGLGTIASTGGRAGEPVPAGPEPSTEVATGAETLGAVENVVVAMVLLVPVAVAIYLARKLRTPPEPDVRYQRTGRPAIGDLSAIGLLLLPFLLIVLDAAPILVLYVVWSAGVVLLWLSEAWSGRAKTLATLLAPGGGTLGLLLLQAADATGAVPATARDVLGMLAMVIFAVAAVVPPIYLGRGLRSGERRSTAGGLAGAR